jgi:hypothetical protein
MDACTFTGCAEGTKAKSVIGDIKKKVTVDGNV